MGIMRFRLLWILTAFTFGIAAAELDDIRQNAQSKTDAIRDESNKKVAQILARFAEFRNDLEKIKPGLNIKIPVDAKRGGKMRIIDHPELPGLPEFKKVFAIVTEDYKLKTWHSDTDSQNLDKVKQGDKVEVIMVVNPRTTETTFGWALIRTASGSEGYLPQKYLKNLPEETIPSTAKKENKYVFISTGLRMRSEPTLAGEFLVLVPYETEVVVTGYSKTKDTIDGFTDFWAETSFDGKKGWLFNAYLRPVGQKPQPEPPEINPNGFSMPVGGRITSKFGPRIDPVTKKAGDFHRGIDIAASSGTEIKAAKDGEVFENSKNAYWGNYIILKHAGNVFTYYCHQSKTKSLKGQKVTTSDVIGYVGRTGKATGPHLHFEVRLGGDPKDPLQYVK
jgi:murein DD-endopeptidase MepM/ murein hydrolase activator NlpD